MLPSTITKNKWFFVSLFEKRHEEIACHNWSWVLEMWCSLLLPARSRLQALVCASVSDSHLVLRGVTSVPLQLTVMGKSPVQWLSERRQARLTLFKATVPVALLWDCLEGVEQRYSGV